MLRLSRLESDRNPAWKPDSRPGSSIVKHATRMRLTIGSPADLTHMHFGDLVTCEIEGLIYATIGSMLWPRMQAFTVKALIQVPFRSGPSP